MPREILIHRIAARSGQGGLGGHPRALRLLDELQRFCQEWWFAPPRPAHSDPDCVEGWLVAPDHAFDLFAAFNLALWPAAIQVGMGGPVLAPAVAPRFVHQRFGGDLPDVAAFLDRSGAPFHLHADQRAPEELALVELASFHYRGILDHWTERQAEVVRLRRDLGSAAKVARRLQISEQVARRTLVRAGDRGLRRIETRIGAWLRARLHLCKAEGPRPRRSTGYSFSIT